MLYHLDQDRLECEQANAELRAELEQLKEAENELARNLKASKQKVSAARRATASAEQQRVEIDTSPLVKVETEIKSLTTKLKKDEAALVKQKAVIDTQKEKMQRLETEIAEYKQSLDDLIKDYERSQGEMVLTPDQEQEWERVKQAAAAASAEPRRKLLQANRDLAKERSHLSTDTEADDLVKQATQDVNEHTERKTTLETVRWLMIRSFMTDHCIFIAES
jgi:chromosome segregation ATPase